MKFIAWWGLAAALVVVCQLGAYATASESSSVPRQSLRRPNELNLKTPIDKILKKVVRLQNVDLVKLLNATIYLVVNCIDLGGLLPFSESPAELHHKLEQRLLPIIKNHSNEIEATIQSLDKEEMAHVMNELCQTDLFRVLHTYMWQTDSRKSLNDLVRFFWRFGYPGIYQTLKAVYTAGSCPQDLIDMIPDNGDVSAKNAVAATRSKRSLNIREQHFASILNSSSGIGLSQFQLKCPLTEIIGLFQGTGILDLLMLINTAIHEVIQQPSIHFLLGKVQEPVKGHSYRECRLLEEFRRYIYNLDMLLQTILKEFGIYDLIHDIIGIDLSGTQLIHLVIELVGTFMWPGNYEHVDPYVPPAP